MKVYSDLIMKKELIAWWEKNSYIYARYEEYYLCVEYWPGTKIYHSLGSIKKTNDGRWRWTVINSKDYRFKTPKGIDKLQGVVQTKEEAQTKLETIWSIKND